MNAFKLSTFCFLDSEAVDDFTEAFKTAVNDQGSLSYYIAQCMAFGPPGVGKSCLYNRLLDKEPPSKKKAVSESTETAPRRKTVSSMTEFKSQDYSTTLIVAKRDKWNEVGKLKDERKIYLRSTSMPTDMLRDTSNDSRPLSPHSKTDLDNIVIDSSTQDVASKADTNHIQTVVTDKSITINYTDLKGQPEFYEALPALVAGPTIFLLVFSLHEGLHCKHTFPYESSCENYTTYFTVQQILMRCLSNIANYYRMRRPTQSSPTKVVIIGTHSDLVEHEKIQAIDAELQRSINNTILETDELIEPYSSDLCLIPIDNYNPDDGSVIRSVIERVITREVGKVCPYKIEIPVPWCSLNICLQKQGYFTISYDECLDLARKFNITDEDFPHCLNFLHCKTGAIRYYSGIKELSNTIIIKHCILFDSVTELITSTFSIANVGGKKSKIFKTLGLFKATDAQSIFEKHKEKLISFDQFVALLKHLNILGQAHGLSMDNETFDYFLPCALVRAPESNELFDHNSLLISFESGFVPKGVFCGLLAFLSNREFIILRNLKGRPLLYRNQATFQFSNENYIINIEMKVTAKLLVFGIKFNDEQRHVSAYVNMRTILEEGMQTVSKTFKYLTNWYLGLYCSHSTCKGSKVEDHIARFDWSKSCLTCSLTGSNYKLTDEPEIADWFTSLGEL